MSAIEKLELLTRQMHLEPSGEISDLKLTTRSREAITVKAAQLPNGQTIRLLKTLLSSYCDRNCHYCPFRSGLDSPRAAFTPDDFARLFDSLYRAGFVEGIFLSSSIFHSSVSTQDKLLDTATLLRERYHFQGYLHLKIMPGAERSQIEEAMKLADRLSVNLEAPHPRALKSLAPQKEFLRDLVAPLRWIEEIRATQSPSSAWKKTWPSSTTQFVVGAADETDLDILTTTSFLQRTSGISRAYFSSFSPVPGTPLENRPPSPQRREFRLYQASFLLRDYGFSVEELPFQADRHLPLTKDPKQAWAEEYLLHDPVEINTAPRELLLRVPGLGPKRVAKILAQRRQGPINSFSQLRKQRLADPQTAPFILLNGRRAARQTLLF